MKCPKCGYLGFELLDACRNCGFDFSFASPPAASPEMPLRDPAESVTRFDDLDRLMAAPEPASKPQAEDLPLFSPATLPDDEPLIKTPASPRPPLAVRRATPEVPRARTDHPRAESLDLRFDEPRPVRVTAPPATFASRSEAASSEPVDDAEPAGVFRRLFAAVIDIAILSAIDVLVVYLTLEICGLSLPDVNVLPKGPLIAFLVVQNGAYLVALTAGGQTLGKMAAGIRVVSAEPREPLNVGRAFLREALWIALAAPAGLGFVSALFSAERRGLHDRFAGTRVVR
jgi:uncharacterized RDD family membrane protein YckC